MAEEPEIEVKDLENTETEELEEQDEGSEAEAASTEGEDTEEGEEEIVIGFGDEDDTDADEETDTPVIKKLRERNREQTRILREKERELAEIRANVAQPAALELGPEPTMEDCDFDDAKFKAEIRKYDAKKAEVAKAQENAQAEARKANESWERDFNAYNQRKASLPVTNYQDAEDAVRSTLSLAQQAVIVKAAKDPAALVYALGNSPSKLAEIAKQDDPIKFAVALTHLEGTVKVIRNKKAPAPNRPERGSASMQTLDTDKELERLEKEAEKTGVRTAVVAYKRQLKAQGK